MSMYGKQLSGIEKGLVSNEIVLSRTTELTTIYNILILLKQKPDSFVTKT